MGAESLWPNIEIEETRSPFSMLKEQADLLTKLTKKKLIGEVQTMEIGNKAGRGPNFRAYLNIMVPALNEYTVTILSLTYNINTLYPVSLNSNIIPPSIHLPIRINTKETLLKELRHILNSDEVKKLISSLLEHVKAVEESKR